MPVAPETQGIDTRNPDLFAEAMAPVAEGIVVSRLRRGSFHAEAIISELPGIGVFETTLTNARVATPQPRDYLAVTVPQKGGIEITNGHVARSYGSRDAHVLDPEHPLDLRSADAAPMLVASFNSDRLHRYAERLTGDRESPRLRFDTHLSLETRGGASFRRILKFVWRETSRPGSLLRSPLVYREVSDVLREAFLQLAMSGEAWNAAEARRGRQPFVGRVEDYIDGHLDQPLSLASLSEVAGVSASTLNRAFHKRHGKGPIAFLKVRRLERVYDELLRSEPGSVTVTEVALRYGFAHLSQFSKDYRREFDELPSETLNS